MFVQSIKNNKYKRALLYLLGATRLVTDRQNFFDCGCPPQIFVRGIFFSNLPRINELVARMEII